MSLSKDLYQPNAARNWSSLCKNDDIYDILLGCFDHFECILFYPNKETIPEEQTLLYDVFQFQPLLGGRNLIQVGYPRTHKKQYDYELF